MFTRAFFFFLLGVTLALAIPAHEDHSELRVERSAAGEKVAAWWRNSEEKFKKIFSSIKSTFSNLWGKITGKARNDPKHQKLIELKDKYEQLQEESLKAVERIKTEWDVILADKEQILADLKQQANDDIEHEIEIWNERFNQLKEEANEIMNTTE